MFDRRSDRREFLDTHGYDPALAQKAYGFDLMSKGWVLGSASFKRALIEDHKRERSELELG